jgi:hypothetical protein
MREALWENTMQDIKLITSVSIDPVEIPDDQAEDLREYAEAAGKTIEEFVLHLIEVGWANGENSA